MEVKNYVQIFRHFTLLDKKIVQNLSKINQNSFVRLWISQKDYFKHLKKRLKHKDIKNRKDYFQKTLQTICSPDTIYYLKGKNPSIKDKVLFIQKGWVVIFFDNAKIITSFPLKISLQDLLEDRKNKNYLQIQIPLSQHNVKKVIICQKKESYATHNPP
ncbi:hypothetical protein NitYY0826_C0146 [Nitratiruptor sp. YY08-26]|uniref:hypothetical protein n=1 Tax=unclassified Nitratiruptor TaxID=2624044 RepID=UPI001914F0DA|nr:MULTISPECIES: hypothetical protein [unclassified Nitratiruptor]BCD61307.1 hypothetical protein NitYY0813_C0146 [Nitratiruptor sp. YY08-13]BCD65240.1 hypothetical protein NitYY0826_C0146 [Nitratiruptor sp. YY08-26]